MKVTLTITWEGPRTPVNVTGPIDDKCLCYGLLEAAKDAVRDHIEQNRKLVAPAYFFPEKKNLTGS
jgi:hypothetical protein